jgi:tetratricopeptide (TPR) repeat protein
VQDRGGQGSDLRETVKGDKRALVIGVSDYQENTLDLRYADDDARLFRDYLLNVEKLDPKNIQYLENEDAHAQAIYQGIDELLKVTQEGDEVYIYFAGHGDVVNRENEKVGFLLAHDVNGGRNYRGTDGVVALSALNKFVNQLTTTGANVVMALDACHSGFIYEEGAKTNMNTLSDGNNFVKTTKFLSCAPSQTSQEDAELGHGYFTFYLVLGMMGAADDAAQDNQLKYGELDDYIYDEVSQITNAAQEPLIITSNRRQLFKNLTSENKEIAMLAQSKSIKLKDTLRLVRSTQLDNFFPVAPLSPIEKVFSRALELENYFGDDTSAMSIYKKAVQENSISNVAMSRMRFTLSRKLTISANRLINLYISGPKDLPAGSEFLKESKNVYKAMELIDADHPTYNALHVSALFLEAYSYIRNKDYQQYPVAEKLLLQAIELEARAAYVLNALGILANENQQYKKAQSYYEKAIQLINTWVYPVNNKATNYFDQYDLEKAEEFFNRALQTDPEYNTAKQNLAAIASRKGLKNEAERQSKEMIEAGLTNTTLYTNIAELLTEKGNIKAAQSYYLKGIELNPTDVDGLMAYSEFILENGLTNIDPEQYLNKAMALQPGYAKTLANYAEFLRRRKPSSQNFVKAKELYEQAIVINPYYIYSYVGMGYLLHDQDQPGAEEAFKLGIQNNIGKVEPLYYLARFKKNQLKQLDSALAIHKKIININPYYKPSYKESTSILQSLGRDQEAIEMVDLFINKAGKNPDNLLLMGNTLFAKGDKTESVAYYKEALVLDPTHSEAAASLAYALITIEEYKESLPYIAQSIDANPFKYEPATFSSVLNRQARSLKRKDEPKEALKILKVSYELDKSLENSYSYATELYLNGETKEAAQIFNTLKSDSKSWIEKLLVLQIKIAIDANEAGKAAQLITRYKQLSTTQDRVLEFLSLKLSGKEKQAKDLKENINALLLTATRLKRSYSDKAIQLITKE